LSTPVCRMRRIASPTVMFGFRLTYSVVITLPAEFSGYCRISLISLRICGSLCARIRCTTFAGISSTMSTASSTYSSSITCFSSLSLMPRIRASCWSLSISTKHSAACSFGSKRNISGSCSGLTPANTAATSAGFIVTSTSRIVVYFFSLSSTCRVFSMVTLCSAISRPSVPYHFRWFSEARGQARVFSPAGTRKKLPQPFVKPRPPERKRAEFSAHRIRTVITPGSCRLRPTGMPPVLPASMTFPPSFSVSGYIVPNLTNYTEKHPFKSIIFSKKSGAFAPPFLILSPGGIRFPADLPAPV